eukprot:11176990-Lingulodinium_polyedra.AAC.1
MAAWKSATVWSAVQVLPASTMRTRDDRVERVCDSLGDREDATTQGVGCSPRMRVPPFAWPRRVVGEAGRRRG